MIKIPPYAKKALDILNENGYSAYIVGGCVRDMLLGTVPCDYDITTNALPEQIKSIFNQYHVIETGIKHGTITVVIDKKPLEITTYRIDGEYKDNRRPESVIFTDNVNYDLARRDFTINAMAYNQKSGLVDIFGGKDDLSRKLIRCVGDATTRFKEDALRILRALRFASVLCFDIDKSTSISIHENKALLKNIAAERIQAEFFKLICGKNAARIINEYKDVIAVFAPKIESIFDFEQHSKYHIYDVWEHSICTLSHTEPKLTLRLAALFHDIGKSDCFTIDENGAGHFYSHAKFSTDHTRDILNALKCDNATKNNVLKLISYHDAVLCDSKKSIKKWLSKLGEELFFDLISLQKADTLAHNPNHIGKRIEQLDKIKNLTDEVILEGECFSLKDLAVNGHDMISVGIKGEKIGHTLKELLSLVIDSKIENKKKALIEMAKKLNNI